MTTETYALIKAYAANGSEDAFRELVTRYIGLVYSTALRQVGGDTHLAEDVSQTVFSDLAKHVRELSADVMLGGWLHQRAFNVARTMMRSELRRHAREKEAVEMSLLEDHTAANLAQFGPALDEALMRLNPDDRVVIILRFFEHSDLRSVGEVFGLNEDAAQKRVSRALDKMRLVLGRSGVTLSASALGAILSAEQVTAAPAGLAATVTAAALSATTIPPTAVIVASKAIGMTTIQKIAVGAVLAAAVGTGIYESRQAARERSEKLTLQQAQAPLAASIERLQSELDDATKRLARTASKLAPHTNKDRELMILRGEVGRLRRESQELAKMTTENTSGAGLADTAWLDRVALLKQRLKQTPEAQIPEMQFLTDEDWLSAASRKLDTDDDYYAAFDRLRARSEHKFLNIAGDALRKYLKAEQGQFPTALPKLTPYFEAPPAAELLNRYHIVPESSGGWLITLKTPDSESLLALGKDGLRGTSAPDAPDMNILGPAMKALFDATPFINGRREAKMEDVAPYLTTPEQQAAYERIMERNKAASK